MSKKSRDRRPYVKPVTRIELSESNIRLRWILIVVLLAVAIVSFAVGLMSMLSTEPGWQAVEVTAQETNCGTDFVFQYDFTDSGSGATAEYKRLSALYSEAVVDAYRIFTADVLEEGLCNVAYLNAHVNETVTVEPALYRALEQVVTYGDRHVFTAPAMMEYNRVFLCESEEEARLYDPAQNPETAAWLGELAQFVNDPDMISLEVLGENQVRLNVADAYLAYAEENGIETFLDFGWMLNAFRADYLAGVLAENGFTNGYLSSFDGFTRNLDTRGVTYSMNLFDAHEAEIFTPARMQYFQPMSIVFLRGYPMDELDRWHYYAFSSGEIVTAFLDPADCMSKNAADNLVSYSADLGCAEILLQTAPLFVAEDFQTTALNDLSGIRSIWFAGQTMQYNDPALAFEALTEGGGELYTFELVK